MVIKEWDIVGWISGVQPNDIQLGYSEFVECFGNISVNASTFAPYSVYPSLEKWFEVEKLKC